MPYINRNWESENKPKTTSTNFNLEYIQNIIFSKRNFKKATFLAIKNILDCFNNINITTNN